MVTSLLFLAIFTLAIGDKNKIIGTIPFQQYLAAGLIMMTMVQNAFANASSSLIMGKVIGCIIDLLMPPLSASEITIAMVAGGITRGLLSGFMVAAAIWFFVPFYIYDFWLMLFYSFFACSLLSAIGVLAGIIADSFDQMHAITSYIVTPLAFLSGTFYSMKSLPEFWQIINYLNPFFYMIDGFRYSLTGHNDGSITFGIIMLLAANIFTIAMIHRMLVAGYRMKT